MLPNLVSRVKHSSYQTDTLIFRMDKVRLDFPSFHHIYNQVCPKYYYYNAAEGLNGVLSNNPLQVSKYRPSTNKKSFRQVHAEDIAKYEEALRILKQHSPDGKFPTMKDLRTEKEQLTIQKDAQYDTYHYFRDYHKELQTVCANVDSILETEREAQHEQQQSRKNEHFL